MDETCAGCGATVISNGFCAYCRRYRERAAQDTSLDKPRRPPPTAAPGSGRLVRMAELQRDFAQFIVEDGRVIENPYRSRLIDCDPPDEVPL